MTPEQLAALVASGESETLEFKRTTGERREGGRTLCAMLNHRGGRVLFGVEAGRPIGQHVSDRTIEELAQELGEIDPPVFPTIDRVTVDGGREVLVVAVSTGQSRPYTHRGRAYRRVGNTSPEMSADEYNRVLLERLHGEHRWENQPATGLTVDDLDSAEIIRSVEEAIRRGRAEDPATRDPTELLRGFGLIRDGRIVRAAAVLFGRADRLETEYPQCLLRVAISWLLHGGVHILRHTFCSHLAMRGAPARAIQELAGHADLTMTQRYMHLSPAALDSAIRLLEQPAGPARSGRSVADATDGPKDFGNMVETGRRT